MDSEVTVVVTFVVEVPVVVVESVLPFDVLFPVFDEVLVVVVLEELFVWVVLLFSSQIISPVVVEPAPPPVTVRVLSPQPPVGVGVTVGDGVGVLVGVGVTEGVGVDVGLGVGVPKTVAVENVLLVASA